MRQHSPTASTLEQVEDGVHRLVHFDDPLPPSRFRSGDQPLQYPQLLIRQVALVLFASHPSFLSHFLAFKQSLTKKAFTGQHLFERASMNNNVGLLERRNKGLRIANVVDAGAQPLLKITIDHLVSRALPFRGSETDVVLLRFITREDRDTLRCARLRSKVTLDHQLAK